MSRVWLNGTLSAAAEARIDPADRGFTLGDGVFETLALEAGRPAHLALHLARLRHGAARLAIALAWSDAAIAHAIAAVAGGADGAMRLTLTRGPGARGLLPDACATPTLCIRRTPLPEAGAVSAIICRTTRRNEHSPLAAIKSLNYLDSILARQEAAAAGADDAILLNTAGRVAEASAANVFAYLDGRWLTPPVIDGALPGIARHLLLARGAAAEGALSPADLDAAEAIILSNSLCLREVTRVGERRYVGAGAVLAQWMIATADQSP